MLFLPSRSSGGSCTRASARCTPSTPVLRCRRLSGGCQVPSPLEVRRARKNSCSFRRHFVHSGRINSCSGNEVGPYRSCAMGQGSCCCNAFLPFPCRGHASPAVPGISAASSRRACRRLGGGGARRHRWPSVCQRLLAPSTRSCTVTGRSAGGGGGGGSGGGGSGGGHGAGDSERGARRAAEGGLEGDDGRRNAGRELMVQAALI
jgi:hypothetical protein